MGVYAQGYRVRGFKDGKMGWYLDLGFSIGVLQDCHNNLW